MLYGTYTSLTRLACWMTASMSPAPSACGALLPASCCALVGMKAPLPAGAAAAEARMLEAVFGVPFADSMLAVPPGCTKRGKHEAQDAKSRSPTIRFVGGSLLRCGILWRDARCLSSVP